MGRAGYLPLERGGRILRTDCRSGQLAPQSLGGWHCFSLQCQRRCRRLALLTFEPKNHATRLIDGRELPKAGDAVGIELGIDTDEGDALVQRLSHQQSVERVFVMRRHVGQQGCVSWLDV